MKDRAGLGMVLWAEAEGKLWSMNGKLGMAASLYKMLDGYEDAVNQSGRHETKWGSLHTAKNRSGFKQVEMNRTNLCRL